MVQGSIHAYLARLYLRSRRATSLPAKLWTKEWVWTRQQGKKWEKIVVPHNICQWSCRVGDLPWHWQCNDWMVVHLAGELKYTCQRIPYCSACYSPKFKAETFVIASGSFLRSKNSPIIVSSSINKTNEYKIEIRRAIKMNALTIIESWSKVRFAYMNAEDMQWKSANFFGTLKLKITDLTALLEHWHMKCRLSGAVCQARQGPEGRTAHCIWVPRLPVVAVVPTSQRKLINLWYHTSWI